MFSIYIYSQSYLVEALKDICFNDDYSQMDSCNYLLFWKSPISKVQINERYIKCKQFKYSN